MSLLKIERDLQFIFFEQLNVQATHSSSDLNQEKLQKLFENRLKTFEHPFLEAASDLYLLSIQSAKQKTVNGKTLLQFPETRRILATMKSYVEATRALLHKMNFFSYLLQQEQTGQNDPENLLREYIGFLTPVFDFFSHEKILQVADLAKNFLGDRSYSMETIFDLSPHEKKYRFLTSDFISRQITFQEGKNFRAFCHLLQKFIDENGNHPTLNQEVLSLKKILNLSQESVSVIFEKTGKNENLSLHSTPFLQMTGYLVFGWLLLEQALIALPKLEAIWAKENATVEEPKFAICENNPEARFYEAKVKTARFYIWNLLPFALGVSQTILSEDQSAMKIRF